MYNRGGNAFSRNTAENRVMFRNRVKTRLFPSLILVAATVASVRGEVRENSSQYPCCKPALEFNQQRENTWTINNQNFAYFNGGEQSCIPPCKKIEDGVMTLKTCVDVNTTVVWTDEKEEEERISFFGQPCPGSLSDKMAPGNHGSVGLVLLLVLIGGFAVNQMTG